MSLEMTRFFEQQSELLQAFAQTFIARWDTYPYQLPDGSYTRAHTHLSDGTKQYHSLQMGHLEAHLKGQQTLGTYILDRQSRTTKIVLDDDSDQGLDRLKKIGQDLSHHEIPSYLEQSRRGGHLWIFTPPLYGLEARRIGTHILAQYGLTPREIELYPKQNTVQPDQVGSLVRLPLGKHLKSGLFYGFVDFEGKPLAPRRRDQMAILAQPERVSQKGIDELLASAPELTPHFQIDRQRLKRYSAEMPPDERIKRAIAPLDYISQYVDLDPSGRGLCPFHDDHRQSFKVYADGWHCFAGCEGHTIIDFHLKLRGYADLSLSPSDWKHELYRMMKQLGL